MSKIRKSNKKYIVEGKDINQIRSRHFCFAFYDFDENNKEELISRFTKMFESEINKKGEKKINYILGGFEICPETKRKHVQMYIQLPLQMSRIAVLCMFKKNNIILNFTNPNALQACKGSSIDNQKYCKEDGNYFVIGKDEFIKGIQKKKNQGHRSDLDKIRNLVNEGSNLRNISNIVNSKQELDFAGEYLKLHEKKRKWSLEKEKEFEVNWYWGKPGCHKTCDAKKECEERKLDYYSTMTTGRWWDGYDAHNTVIIDDMRGDFTKYHETLKLLQHHEYRVEVKGNTREMLANKFYITSCHSPIDLYSNLKENNDQLLRRITYLRHYTDEGIFIDINLKNLSLKEKLKQIKEFIEIQKEVEEQKKYEDALIN